MQPETRHPLLRGWQFIAQSPAQTGQGSSPVFGDEQDNEQKQRPQAQKQQMLGDIINNEIKQ